MPRSRAYLLALLPLLLTPSAGHAQAAAKKQLEHSVYGYWNRIASPTLSRDGRWAMYRVEADSIDATLHLRGVGSSAAYRVERADAAALTDDARFAVFLLKPSKAALAQAKKDKKKPEEMPQDTLGIMDLANGQITRVARVKSFKLPRYSGAYVAYLMGKPEAVKDSAKSDSAKAATPPAQPGQQKAEPGKMPEPNPSPAGPRTTPEKKKSEPKREEGTPLVLRTLATGEERRFDNVVSYDFSEDGTKLVYTAGNKDGSADGVYVVDTRTGQVTTLLKGKGNYKSAAIDRQARQVVFLSNTTDFASDQPEYTLYYWDGKTTAAQAIANARTAGLPKDWWVSENGAPSFSYNGTRVFFGTSPRPEPEPGEEQAADEKVVVDVWHWKDPLLQPMQLKQLDQEKKRTYRASYDPKTGRVVQLATAEIPDVDVAQRGEGAIALGSSSLPYLIATQWGEDGTDYYLVDVRTGQATRVLEHVPARVQLSPEGRWLTWFDPDEQQWFALDTRTRQQRAISQGIPTALYNELHDTPDQPNAYGSAGWTKNDELFLVYDRNDIWALDPTGRAQPRNITEGTGRRENLRFRYIRLDPEERAIDPSKDIVLSAFQLETKQDGFYRDRVAGDAAPVQLVMAPKSFGQPRKAERADVLLVTRADFQEFPDLWLTDPSFRTFDRISDANPQQKQYSWGSAELVSWRSDDNQELQGVLYKPEGFDPSKKYPMMVYFYERMSDGLYNYIAPAPGSSSINTSFYVSRGYLVFNPDIPYRVGYPGESAFKAVIPGVLELVRRGYVDDKHIGVQGHSWGGYQIAYLVTKTNIFAAAEAGAPVANMISAYGGIRWGTGMSRQFQYEKTQSRIGGTLWQAPLHFIENSPIFWADKVQTPLLMMHNDEDGAVPWEQGIEYFVALRRLGKPAWMLNYNGEDHGLRKAQNRQDWTQRLQQYFDHYLKGAPSPAWLAEGIPATRKGRTLGLELVKEPVRERPISQQ